MALACPSRTSWRKSVFTTIFLVRGPTGLGGGRSLRARGAARPHPRPVCCSGGARGLLRLPVQPLHPGPPRLPAGEEGECEAAAGPPAPHRAPHVPAAPSAAGRVQPGCSAEARGARGRAHGRPALTCQGTRGPRWELPPILHPLGEALCVRRVCFFLTRFAEFTRETIRAWSSLF